MTGYNPLLRNAQLDAITAFAGAGAKLRIYDGARPATGGAATNLLAEFTLGNPFAPPALSGILSPTLPSGISAALTGTATWFRIAKSDGTQVLDGAIGASGSDLELNSVAITSGSSVTIDSFSISRGNA